MVLRTGPLATDIMHTFEGCRLRAYRCPAGIWTIGWGDTGPHVYEGLVWTQSQADKAFKARLAREFEPGVIRAIGDAPTTPAQFGAMVSLAYNIGVAAFARSAVCRYHRAGQRDKAGAAFMRWVRGGGRVLPGLVARRKAERALYEGRFTEVLEILKARG